MKQNVIRYLTKKTPSIITTIYLSIYIYKVGFFPSYDMWKGGLLICVIMFFLNPSSFKLLQFAPSISNYVLSNLSHIYWSLKFKK